MLRLRCQFRERHLVRAERSFDLHPSTTFGPVQPLGVRSTIIGQCGALVKPFVRASF